jgi:sulfur relay (sulfurtransferase) DsrC/TusE family protein
MPESPNEIKKGEIADLLRERTSDVQCYLRKIEKSESSIIAETAQDENTTIQAERVGKIGFLQENAEFPMDSL